MPNEPIKLKKPPVYKPRITLCGRTDDKANVTLEIEHTMSPDFANGWVNLRLAEGEVKHAGKILGYVGFTPGADLIIRDPSPDGTKPGNSYTVKPMALWRFIQQAIAMLPKEEKADAIEVAREK